MQGGGGPWEGERDNKDLFKHFKKKRGQRIPGKIYSICMHFNSLAGSVYAPLTLSSYTATWRMPLRVLSQVHLTGIVLNLHQKSLPWNLE